MKTIALYGLGLFLTVTAGHIFYSLLENWFDLPVLRVPLATIGGAIVAWAVLAIGLIVAESVFPAKYKKGE